MSAGSWNENVRTSCMRASARAHDVVSCIASDLFMLITCSQSLLLSFKTDFNHRPNSSWLCFITNTCRPFHVVYVSCRVKISQG